MALTFELNAVYNFAILQVKLNLNTVFGNGWLFSPFIRHILRFKWELLIMSFEPQYPLRKHDKKNWWKRMFCLGRSQSSACKGKFR